MSRSTAKIMQLEEALRWAVDHEDLHTKECEQTGLCWLPKARAALAEPFPVTLNAMIRLLENIEAQATGKMGDKYVELPASLIDEVEALLSAAKET